MPTKAEQQALATEALALIGEGNKRCATIAIAQLLGYRTAKVSGLWYIKAPDGVLLAAKVFSASRRPEQEAWEDLLVLPRWLDSLEIAGELPLPLNGTVLIAGKANGTKAQILFDDDSIAGEHDNLSPPMALAMAWLNMVESHIKWSPQRDLLSLGWINTEESEA